MAATPFETALADSSFVFDIYNDGSTARNAPILPGGPCNFVDLAHGANGARCGCRRFWSRLVPAQLQLNPDQAVWCMCSHHACFHDDSSGGHGQAISATAMATAAGQENERPKGNREPLSPVQDIVSFQMPSNLGLSLDFPALNLDASAHLAQAQALAEAQPVAPAPEASIPDTLSWGNYVQSQNGPTTLPPIPSQCLLPSQPPSTSSSSQVRFMRPFSGKGLQTLSSVSKPREPLRESDLAGGPGEDGAPHAADDARASVDDIAYPSAATPRAHETQDSSGRPHSSSLTVAGSRRLSETVHSHEQRLEKLENPSFSVAGHDECQDKHDATDLRVTELELRLDDVEKKLNDDNSTVASSRRLIRDDDATASVVSIATDATARASDRSEIFSQLQSLQAQVSSLQSSSLPSYNSPWELEVVFLPFPLKGIWLEVSAFSAQQQPGSRSSGGDEWTQLPSTLSRRTPDPQSPYLTGWADQGPESGWLLPRACVPGRTIEGRLKSRGLIKTLTVRGSGARSIQTAMSDAFGNVLQMMPSRADPGNYHAPETTDVRVAKFLGLQQAWVPLRKIHKDSRLRFLTPAEMLTPALWDVAFLKSSVIMKATGVHRLYVTQPEAYIQDQVSYESGWSWQRLRELSRVYPDSQGSSSSSHEVPEADAAEQCWAWDSRLDEPPTPNPSSLSLRQGARNSNRSHSSGTASQQFFTVAQSPIMSTSPVALRASSPLTMKERRGSRPPHVRTTSMPPAMPAAISPASQSKRRVASYANVNANTTAYDRRSSPFAGAARPSPRLAMVHSPVMVSAVSKRHGTRSPSVRLRTTPRWSMSRSPSVAPFGPPGGAEDRVRGTTPFCYATPYSNAPPEPRLRQGSRGPVLVVDGYDYDDMDCGSDTDPYDDSQMTHDVDDDLDIEVYEDEADDLDGVDTDAGGGADESPWRGGVGVQQLQAPAVAPPLQLPEDEPWPGIEDNMSDGENMDPLSPEPELVAIDLDDGDDDDDDCQNSDVSSQPSEYPSTQRAWHISEHGDAVREDARGVYDDDPEDDDGDGMGFKIHEDGDVGGPGGGGGGGLLSQYG